MIIVVYGVMEKIYVTEEGREAMINELKALEIDMKQTVEDLTIARSYGDLSENAGYDAARERQRMLNNRAMLLQRQIENLLVVSVKKSDAVSFGAIVYVTNIDTQKDTVYHIVSAHEVDAGANKLSASSPLAAALIGKKQNDIATFTAPSGIKKFLITKIQYPD